MTLTPRKDSPTATPLGGLPSTIISALPPSMPDKATVWATASGPKVKTVSNRAAVFINPSIAKVVEGQGNLGHLFFDQGHGGLQVIALGAGDSYFFFLDGGLNFELAVLDEALDFLGHFGFDAAAYLDDALDLVAAHFLHIAHVQKAHVHI